LFDNKSNANHVGDEENHDKHGLRLMKVPNISQDILSELKRSNITCTARSIVKYLFCNISQNENLTLKNADPGLIDWIVCKSNILYFHRLFLCFYTGQAKELHPNDSTSTAKIRHAMSNVLASLKHKRKRKLLDVNKVLNKANTQSDS
jgi:hypothetical protein